MSDVIEIRGLRVVAAHGVLPAEQARSQPFELDLDVEVDAAAAARNDDLADAVDYGILVELVTEVVRGGPYRLLETIAESVAAAVLARPGVGGVSVTIRKVRPPIAMDVATVGVRVTRRSTS